MKKIGTFVILFMLFLGLSSFSFAFQYEKKGEDIQDKKIMVLLKGQVRNIKKKV